MPLLSFAYVACVFQVVACAWLGDDAFISFRTVDNFVHGYGLRWNVAERVQSFTNPLWTLLLSIPYALTGEMPYTVLAISIAISSLTLYLVAFRLRATVPFRLFALSVLFCSKAFIDYSTSGLETPLANLLFVVFAIFLFSGAGNPRCFRTLCLVACLGTLTRLDLILLYLPALAVAFPRGRRGAGVRALFIGFLPLIAWELFSLVYYGFPFPNTAYAKLGFEASFGEFLRRGLLYYLWSLEFDSVTLLCMFVGLGAIFQGRDARARALAIGAVLYLLYVAKIGGDFMGSRFFAAPLMTILVAWASVHAHDRMIPFAILAVLLLGSKSPNPNILLGGQPESVFCDYNGTSGVVDERSCYSQATSLLLSRRDLDYPNPLGRGHGLAARIENRRVEIAGGIGFYGFYAGPGLHIIDDMALADPLLARLKIRAPMEWRVGHVQRPIPEGYEQTIIRNENVIEDPGLRQYYDRLKLIVSGPLWSWERFETILRMNLGQYDHLLDGPIPFAPSLASIPRTDPVTVDAAVLSRTEGSAEVNLAFSMPGLRITFPKPVIGARKIDFSLSESGFYSLVFLRQGEQIDSFHLEPMVPEPSRRRIPEMNFQKRATFSSLLSERIRDGGFDTIEIRPLHGGPYFSIGFLRVTTSGVHGTSSSS